MVYKKALLFLILSVSLFGSDLTNKKEFVEYSQFEVNNNLSVYAGEVNMKHFREEDVYSVGLLLHNNKKTHTDFGVGYVQPSSKIDLLSQNELALNTTKEDSKMIFFMNCSF